MLACILFDRHDFRKNKHKHRDNHGDNGRLLEVVRRAVHGGDQITGHMC